MPNGSTDIRLRAGDVLFRAGDECAGFLALSQGVVRVALTSAGGREIVLYRVRPGEVCLQTFACLVQGRRYQAEGVAETDIVGHMTPTSAFHARLEQDAGFRQSVLSAVADRFADFEQVVETLAFAGLGQRVARALLMLAGDGDDVHARHEDIAAEIGSAREAVTRQLSAFARDGWVETARGLTRILDRRALQRQANGSG
jgi:CRP/FNR family transcriptional regulator, anaerobic regulatory protein